MFDNPSLLITAFFSWRRIVDELSRVTYTKIKPDSFMRFMGVFVHLKFKMYVFSPKVYWPHDISMTRIRTFLIISNPVARHFFWCKVYGNKLFFLSMFFLMMFAFKRLVLITLWYITNRSDHSITYNWL